MKKWNIIFYSLLFVFYVLYGTLFIVFLAWIYAIADFHLTIAFGLINTLFSYLFFKTPLLKSILIGFLISATGLLCSYVVLILALSLNLPDDFLVVALLSNAITQTVLWKVMGQSLKKPITPGLLKLTIATAITLFISLNLWDYWTFEDYYKFSQKVSLNIQVIDSETGQPMVSDSIELRVQRQPLYGLMIFPKFSTKKTDQDGITSIKVFKGNTYEGYIYRKDNRDDYFKILPEQIVKNDTIQIEANLKYNTPPANYISPK
jgi:hypothetical protein